jgi:hypothetical protein
MLVMSSSERTGTPAVSRPLSPKFASSTPEPSSPSVNADTDSTCTPVSSIARTYGVLCSSPSPNALSTSCATAAEPDW